MSIRKARDFYQALTPQQKHFVDNKTINTTLSVKHWIAFLSKTSDFDEYGDKARNTLMVRMILYGIGAAVSVFFAVEFYYLFAVTIILGILFFDALQTRREFTRRDMNNYLRIFFMPFLEVIKQKAGEDAKLSASLDFSDPLKLTPQKSEVKVYGRKRHIKLYEPKMIIAGVTLSDGTYLETVLTDEIRVISYTNARGKSKSKTKTLHRLFIRLTIDKKLYRLRHRSNFKNIEISEDENACILKLKYKDKVSVASIFEPKIFFNVLGGMYQYVEPIDRKDSPTVERPFKSVGNEITPTENIANALVWNDLIFNDYDYDSTSRRTRGLLGTDDDDSRNVFDS